MCCSVQSPFLLSDPCQQYSLINTPVIDPVWTCGLRSSGNFTCPAGMPLLQPYSQHGVIMHPRPLNLEMGLPHGINIILPG